MIKKPIDFLMVYPHQDIQAYSQRILLGILEEAGFSVHLLIIPVISGIQKNPQLRDSFLKIVEQSRIIGFGFMSNSYEPALYLTKLIKSNFSKNVVWGGPHCTTNYQKVVGEADAIFIGESDRILPRYVEAVIKGKSIEGLPQIVTQKASFIPPQRDCFVENLDELPVPFYSKDGQTLISDYLEDNSEYFRSHFGELHIMTARGCPYSCTYCSNSYQGRFIPAGVKHLRRRSVGHVIREIHHCQEAYYLPTIAIEDDLFLARDNKDLELFVEKYNQEVVLPISITGVTASFLDQEKVKIIRKLPLTSLRVGIQTMSEKGLALYERKVVNKNMEYALKHRQGFPKHVLMRYDIILDNPYEDTADYVKTLRFISRLSRPYGLNLFHLTLHEGTQLRAKAIADGFIDAKDLSYISRPFGKYDDTYINTLFRFLQVTLGFAPSGLIVWLTSSFVLNRTWLQKLLKMLLDTMVYILEKLSFRAIIYRFYCLVTGKYGWLWLRRKYLSSMRHWRSKIKEGGKI